MSSNDAAKRSRAGKDIQTQVLGVPAPEPATPVEASLRDFVFAEVWTRPGLDRRSRFLITISSAACAGIMPDVLDGYIRGALKLGDVTLLELREAALHLAVYGGWSCGMHLDAAITRVATSLGLPAAAYAPIASAPSEAERVQRGNAEYLACMTHPAPPPKTPYFGAGIVNFVFGEMWHRPGLDQRGRRWVTLVGVAHSSCATPIRTHTYATMACRNATAEEMQEFVLQYAIHGSWPKASYIQGVVSEMADRVARGLPYEHK